MASIDRRLRVLALASTFPASADDGTPSFVRDLAVAMARETDTLVLVPAVPRGAQRESIDGVEVRRYRFFPRRWEDVADGALLENVKSRKSRLLQVPPLLIAQYFAIRKAVRAHRPDVIHAHWIIPQGLVARWAARGVPTVVTTLGGDLYALRDPFSRAAKRSVLRRARAVTVMNRDMRRIAIELGADAELTTVRPMGAQVAQFAAAAAKRTSDRTGPVKLLAVGRLVEKKGFHVLLEALAKIPADQWQLTLVGDGPQRRPLESLASGLPVTFVGQLTRSELSQADAAADIAIFPSVRAASGDQDGLPVALLEAMASGCAVVVSDLSGLNEAVVHRESGLVVPSGSGPALRKSIEELLADPELRLTLGQAAATRAQDYDVSRVAQDYLSVLSEASGLASGPAPGT